MGRAIAAILMFGLNNGGNMFAALGLFLTVIGFFGVRGASSNVHAAFDHPSLPYWALAFLVGLVLVLVSLCIMAWKFLP